MGKAFESRLLRGSAFQREVELFLKRLGWEFVPMGAENVAPDVHKKISMMEKPDTTIRFVRYMPDGFAVHLTKEEAFFLDCKYSETIEKDAYLNYITYAGKDRRVYVFIKRKNGDGYAVPLNDLEFLNSHEEVNKYKEKNRMPVDDDGWIAPRLWPKEIYRRWKTRYPRASGTPFKYIDFSCIKKYRIPITASRCEADFPCPICKREHAGYLNCGRDHWFICDHCKVRWLGGSNLFSSWREESEQVWEENAEKLEAYRTVH